MAEEIKRERAIMKIAVPLGAVLAVVHSLAVINDWYRSVSWIDMPIHFLWGGVGVFSIYWLLYRFPGYVNVEKNAYVTLLMVLGWAAIGGVLWEFMEFAYDIIANSYFPNAQLVQFGLEDTLSDLLFNLFGGLSVAIFMWLRYHNHKDNV